MSNPAHEVNHLSGPWKGIPLARSPLVGEHPFEGNADSHAPEGIGGPKRVHENGQASSDIQTLRLRTKTWRLRTLALACLPAACPLLLALALPLLLACLLLPLVA